MTPPRRLQDLAGSLQLDEPQRAAELLSLVDAALAAVEPAAAVARILDHEPLPGGSIDVAALGKAAPAMARGAAHALGERVDRMLVVSDHSEPVPDGARLMLASHPVPDHTSLQAGEELLRFVSEAESPVLFLISGGGSSLAEVPAPGLDLADLIPVYRAMLKTTIPIEEANVVRTHLSAIKGGKLAYAAKGPSTTIVVSDVGDRHQLIASGPTIPSASSPADALAILERHSLTWALTPPAAGVLADPAPAPVVETVAPLVAADGATAVAAAAAAGARRGLVVAARPGSLTGEAARVAVEVIDTVPAGAVAVLSGETTVEVRGEGKGGRNQEAALAAAPRLASTSSMLVTFGTDGIDGPTDAAGAVVDGSTARRIRTAGIDPGAALAENDSHTALAAAGGLIRCGPTGVNVADLWIVDRR